MRWFQVIGGVLLVLVGGVWILQGFNVIGGSSMSGHGQYAVLGAIVALIGLALLVWAARTHQRAQAA
jgi:protein-S-isoprenylcysteine O-methyltransferase Ste14